MFHLTPFITWIFPVIKICASDMIFRPSRYFDWWKNPEYSIQTLFETIHWVLGCTLKVQENLFWRVNGFTLFSPSILLGLKLLNHESSLSYHISLFFFFFFFFKYVVRSMLKKKYDVELPSLISDMMLYLASLMSRAINVCFNGCNLWHRWTWWFPPKLVMAPFQLIQKTVSDPPPYIYRPPSGRNNGNFRESLQSLWEFYRIILSWVQKLGTC